MKEDILFQKEKSKQKENELLRESLIVLKNSGTGLNLNVSKFDNLMIITLDDYYIRENEV